MQYMVVGADGKEYGPSDVSTLKTWVSEGRIMPHSQLRDFHTGRVLQASTIPDLFPVGGAPPAAYAYPRATEAPALGADEGVGMLWGVVLRSVAAVGLFFFLHGIGFVFAGYAMYYAVQCQRSGSKYGIIALAIAGLALAAVGIGWAMRLSGAGI